MVTGFSIVIPMYNEERRISQTLAEILDYSRRGKFKVEQVVVVDDGSKDRATERAMHYVDSLPLQIVRLDKNYGKWAAVSKGLEVVRKDIPVLLMDADGSSPVSELDKLSELPRKDVGIAVMGTRFAKDSKVVAKTGVRRFLSIGYRLYVRFLMWYATGKWGKVDDTQCPFKLFYVDDVNGKIEEQRFSGDFELICRLRGVEFVNLPVLFIDKRGSKVGWRSVVQMFFSTPKCALRMRKFRKVSSADAESLNISTQ